MNKKILKKPSAWIISIVALAIITAAVSYYHLSNTTKATTTAAKATAVTVATVKTQAIPLQLSAVGTVISPRTVMLKAQQAGVIRHIYFHSGEQVHQGQLLLQIDNAKQKAALAAAQANLFSLEADYKRNLLMAKNDQATVSPNTLDQKLGAVRAAKANVAKAKENLLETQVRAPFSGQISALEAVSNSSDATGAALNQDTQITLGGYLEEGDNIVVLTEPKNILIQYQLPQEYSADMAVGQPVQITCAQQASTQTFTGKVSYISPTLLTNSHAYLARATVHLAANRDTLKPGMTVLLTQTLQQGRQTLAVPGLSLVPSLTGFSVYMIENHKARAVPVQTGNRYDTWVAINQGVKAGDKIIVSGLNDIHPGSLVKVTQTL
ncbi:efflux RND transporter periplasmic adaptor subunit [Piscirickettsia litoralis]|uniref:RND efflux pump membrane fusion protein barrel-sandwich domain-containing protein n=1 Tax=Piscirickettsia litoralis TaxID=1891921 RepID=A0ABX3A2M5_9GAMM|nr:efflux RND transporter periplasmic adaptor subunit [Piscirickettsia litoralis]ODN43111.1 hypothetical protein BGC07_09520 [Piscirickettsia litoralis]